MRNPRLKSLLDRKGAGWHARRLERIERRGRTQMGRETKRSIERRIVRETLAETIHKPIAIPTATGSQLSRAIDAILSGRIGIGSRYRKKRDAS